MKRAFLKAGISAMALAGALPAMAQTAAQADRENAQAATAGQDIVVTATRREETLLKAPLSITAYSQRSLDLKGIRNIEDIARITPGVSLNQGTFGIKYLVIRGLSSTVGATMNGVYIDDTPVQVRSISLANNFYPALFDLERVEVLRGPQGTTFGAGSMGGAIRFISAKPSVDKYSGYARAELAFTEQGAPSYEGGVGLGGPIVQDKIGFRVSGYYRRDGGYIDRIPYVANRGIRRDDANSRISYVGQAALTFKPTERLTITPSVFYQQANRDESDQFWTSRPGAPVPLTPNPFPAFTSGEGGASFGKDRAIIYALKGSLDLGPITLISNTAFVDRTVHTSDDGTSFFLDVVRQPQAGGALETAGISFGSKLELHQKQRAFTQELRLQSNGSGPLSYFAGVFYQNSRQSVLEFDTAANPTTFVLPTVNGNMIYGLDKSRDEQIAAFAQVDYKLFDKLKLTAGLRYSKLTVDYTNQGGHGLASDPIAGGRTTGKPLTPKFGVEYQATDRVMVYATAAKGFRPGGPNPGANTTITGSCQNDLNAVGLSAIPRSYNSDSVWSYEIGAKGKAGGVLTFAADVFQLDWSDVQRSRQLTACTQNFISNLGNARVRGVEAQIILSPARGLSIDTNFSYNDAVARSTIQNFALVGGVKTPSGTVVTKGDRFAPKWLISVAGDYQAQVRQGVTGYAHLQYDYRSGYALPNENAGFNPLEGHVYARHLLSGRLGVRRGGTDVSFFVNNIANSQDELSRRALGSGQANRLLRQTYRPRTFGFTASQRW